MTNTKSVEHCVIANGSNNMVSLPIFLHPKATSVIGPLKEVLQNGEKPIYKKFFLCGLHQHLLQQRS